MRLKVDEYKIMCDYVSGIETSNGLTFPTEAELAAKYGITIKAVVNMRKKYGELWDQLRARLMSKGFETAFMRMPIAKIAKLEDSFQSMIESLGKLFDGYADKIANGEIEIQNTSDFLKVTEMLTSLKEKKAGRDPGTMFGVMINAIWDRVADKNELEQSKNMLDVENGFDENSKYQ